MDLLTTPEQETIVGAAADFLTHEMPGSLVRTRRDEATGFDRRTWTRCAALGWFGLGIPAEAGGVGGTAVEEALLFREIGRALSPGPFLATVLGAHLAAAAGVAEIAGGIIGGDLVVGVAVPRPGAPLRIGADLGGSFDLVDAAGAELVLAADPGHAVLVETSSLPPPRPVPALDPAVRLGHVEVDAVRARVAAEAAAAPIRSRGALLVAAMHTGIAEATRDLSVEHARNRVQFGRPIGANQAIRHRCSDMAVRAEAARAQLLVAALSFAADRPDAPYQIAAARAVASDAALANAAATIQIHGGMGYTDEHDAHLFLKRARLLDLVWSDPFRHRRVLADWQHPHNDPEVKR